MAVVVEGEELLAVELPLAAQGLQVLLDKVMLAVLVALVDTAAAWVALVSLSWTSTTDAVRYH
jgi:hypothetical protein